jgi:hypothetical protein
MMNGGPQCLCWPSKTAAGRRLYDESSPLESFTHDLVDHTLFNWYMLAAKDHAVIIIKSRWGNPTS